MMDTDRIDGIVEQWSRERPELDASGFEITGRLLVLGKLLERRVSEALAPLDLSLWEFDVLATLRRQGTPYRLTPTELSRATMLTPAAMTNRLDRLEAKGLLRRESDPGDRRGVRVVLQKRGISLVNRALEVRFEEARSAAEHLPLRDRRTLEVLLRQLLLALEDEAKGAEQDM